MSERTVVGLTPWLPGPLARSAWWTEPVPAERLAALRIGVAAVLLLDILGTYWPSAADLFAASRLRTPELHNDGSFLAYWYLAPLAELDLPWLIPSVLLVWASAAGGLLLGVLPRLSAAAAWLLALFFRNLNPLLLNAGDLVRLILLFYLMLCPCGAVWTLRRRVAGPVFVPPWPVRLLFIQLVIIYFANGLFKLASPQWRQGDSLYYVMANLDWTRWSYAELPMPFWLTQLLTWLTLGWEIGFPFLVLFPWTRLAALLLGVCFHVGTGLSLKLGPFPLYMLCLYLPLVPWERWRRPAATAA